MVPPDTARSTLVVILLSWEMSVKSMPRAFSTAFARAQNGQPGLENITTGSGALASGAMWRSMVSASDTSNGSASGSFSSWASMNMVSTTPSRTSIE